MLKSIFPVLAVRNLARARGFYETLVGLQVGFASDWYLHLLHPTNAAVQLGLVIAGHSSVPSGSQEPNHSLVLTLEVDDVDFVHRKLGENGTQILGSPKDEAWGQRHFLAVDTEGFLIDVVQSIAPSSEYASSYVERL